MSTPQSRARRAMLLSALPGQLTVAQIAKEVPTRERQSQFLRQDAYLVRPFTATMRNDISSSFTATYSADGFLNVERTGAVQIQWPRYGSQDAQLSGRPVTIDMSVCIRGIFAEDFGKKDLIFVGAAMAADLAAYYTNHLRSDGRVAKSYTYRSWDHSIPVPLDVGILDWATWISKGATEFGSGRLTRTDLLCAATAIHYASPLYTTDPEKYDGIGNGLKLIQYGPPLPAPPEKTEPEWADTVAAVNRGRAVSDRLIAPLLDSSIPLDDRANLILYALGRVVSDDRGWKDAILAIADQLPFRELDDDLRQDLIGALGGSWPLPRPRKVLEVIGDWGIWPTDASDEILAELADETYDWGALDWYRSYLLWGGLDASAVDEELARVERGESVPSRERIDHLIAEA